MAARAGTAFIDVRGDWRPFNRQLASQGPVISRAGNRLGGQFGSQLSRGASFAMKGAVIGVAGGFALAVKKAADFEAQQSSLGAVVDTTTAQMERLRKQALKAGADTKFSALEAAQAQTELAKGGLSASKILGGALQGSLALAAAGEMDLATAAATTANALNLFNLKGDKASHVADAFAMAANKTTADVGFFAEGLAQGGLAAKTAGLTFDETTAALEALAANGFKSGSDAGTSLKTMLTQLASPTKKAAALAEQMGLKFFDAHGSLKPLPDLADMLRKKLGNLSDEQRLQVASTLVGQDGMRGLISIFQAGGKEMSRYEKDLRKQGTAAEVAKKKQDNLKGSFEQLRGSAETLGIAVGTAAIPEIRHLTDDVTGLTNKISRIVQRDDLDLGQKLDRIFTVTKVDAQPWIDDLKHAVERADLPGKLADGISAATPKIADAAAHAAPVVAGAFVKSWMDSSVWGRLAMGGFLLSKMGGPAAFAALGRRGGREMAPGIAAGVASGTSIGAAVGTATAAQTVSWVRGPGGAMVAQIGTSMGTKMAPGVATGFKMSGLRAGLAGLMRTWGPALGVTLGATLGPELFKSIKLGTAKESPTFKLPSFEGSHGGLPGLREMNHFFERLVSPENEKKLKDFGDTAERELARATRAGDSAGLAHLADQARGLAREFPKASGELYKFADAAGAAARDATGSFRDVSRLGGKSLQKIVTATANTGFEIKQSLGYDTAEAKKALAKNFANAAKAIKKSMDAGVISTKEGTRLIEQYMVSALQNMGFSKQQALSLRKAQKSGSTQTPGANGELRPNQRGGLYQFGRPGDVGPDSIAARVGGTDIAVAPGEVAAVFNRHQLPIVNQRLADYGGLPGLFQRVKTPHRFQGGGMVPAGGFPDAMGALPGLDALAWVLKKRFGLGVTSGLRPGAITTTGNPSDHGWGGAIDVSNGVTTPQMDAAHAWLLRAMRPAIKQMLYRTLIGGNHFNHIHVALQRAFASNAAAVMRLAGMGTVDIPKLDVLGPDSMLRSMVQGAIDTTRAGAQAHVKDLIGFNPGGLIGTRHGVAMPGTSGGASSLASVLRTVRNRKSPKVRREAVNGLLEKIKGIGLPKEIEARLRKEAGDGNTFGDFADRASQLTFAPDGSDAVVLGLVNGKTQTQWLEDQLQALFRWRNAIVEAEQIVVAKREETAKLIEKARARLKDVVTEIHTAAGVRHRLEHDLAVAKKHPKSNKALIKALTGKIKVIDGQQRPRERVRDALKDKILPALTGKRSSLNTARGELLSNLETVQGPGSPMDRLTSLPALGVLGGSIFDVQMKLRDLNVPKPTVTDPAGTESQSASILAELLREEKLRTAVSQKQFEVFRDMPPYGGSFKTGGVVPGPIGAPRTIVAHGGETVTPADGGSRVRVVIQDERVRVFVDDVEQIVERMTRRQARSGARGLPGRAGVIR